MARALLSKRCRSAHRALFSSRSGKLAFIRQVMRRKTSRFAKFPTWLSLFLVLPCGHFLTSEEALSEGLSLGDWYVPHLGALYIQIIVLL
jgi:hypothetical protein